MEALKFCPKCGKETLLWNGATKLTCSDCDFVLFHNIAAAVAVVLRFGDEFFFTRRNQMPQKGKLDLAGGFVDPNETAEKCCTRELSEELKLDIDPSLLKYKASLPNIYHYKGIDYHTLDLFYEYEVSGKFDVEMEQSEISETLWLKKAEIKTEELAFESQKKFFRDFYL